MPTVDALHGKEATEKDARQDPPFQVGDAEAAIMQDFLGEDVVQNALGAHQQGCNEEQKQNIPKVVVAESGKFQIRMPIVEHPVNQHGKCCEYHTYGDVGVGRAEPLDLVAVNEDERERHQDKAPKEHANPADAVESVERHEADVTHQHDNQQCHKQLQAHHQVVHVLPRQSVNDMVGHDARQLNATKDHREDYGEEGREVVARRHLHHNGREALERAPKFQDTEDEIGEGQNRHEGGIQADKVAQHHAQRDDEQNLFCGEAELEPKEHWEGHRDADHAAETTEQHVVGRERSGGGNGFRKAHEEGVRHLEDKREEQRDPKAELFGDEVLVHGHGEALLLMFSHLFLNLTFNIQAGAKLFHGLGVVVGIEGNLDGDALLGLDEVAR